MTDTRKKQSGRHANPRILVTATPVEIDSWTLASEIAGAPSRAEWLKSLANRAAQRILRKTTSVA